MKKIVTLLAFLVLTITVSFAGGNDINKNVLAAFSGNFAKATNVKWEKNDDYYSAAFQLNGHSLNAIFSEEGTMIAVSRNLLSTELPINLQSALNKSLDGSWISGLVEYAVNDVTIYYATIENADEKIILQSEGTYDWSALKKIGK